MKDGGQNAASGKGRTRLGQVLLGMQVGACFLLVLAGTALQSLQAVLASGPGFDFRLFAVMDVSLSGGQIEGAEAAAFWSHVKRDLQVLPQTERISLSGWAPLRACKVRLTIVSSGNGHFKSRCDNADNRGGLWGR